MIVIILMFVLVMMLNVWCFELMLFVLMDGVLWCMRLLSCVLGRVVVRCVVGRMLMMWFMLNGVELCVIMILCFGVVGSRCSVLVIEVFGGRISGVFYSIGCVFILWIVELRFCSGRFWGSMLSVLCWVSIVVMWGLVIEFMLVVISGRVVGVLLSGVRFIWRWLVMFEWCGIRNMLEQVRLMVGCVLENFMFLWYLEYVWVGVWF